MSRSPGIWPSPVAAVLAALTLLLGLVGAAAAPAGVAAAPQQGMSIDQLEQLRFRHIGPVGNRVAAVAGIPGDPLTYYAGAATGGVWKTEDGGINWEPIFDDQPVHAIGALEVALSDSQIVWAGTGEPHIRSNVSIGDGVYKSTDGGDHWQNMGLAATGRISDIVIHPNNPDIVFVAALGHGHSPQPERGIFRTTDGGATWEHVLFVDENTGSSSLVIDPNNPRILFAGMWQVAINTWNRESGGPGSGIHMSRDGGDTWTELEGNGLPTLPFGKVGLCMTAADSNRIYALIETGDGVPWHEQDTESGELWRSDDGGDTWLLATHDRQFGGRTAYYNTCAASPDDPDDAYFLSASFVHSIDGGRSQLAGAGRGPGGDNHDMWIDPTDGDRMVVGNDGAFAISHNRGKTWNRIQLPIAQMYHVTVDNSVPYYVLGNRQDGPSTRGPSNSRTGGFGGGGIPRGMWHSVGGGESGFATPDPEDPNIIWSSTSGLGAAAGIVVRYNEQTRQFRQVEVWPQSTLGWPAEDLRYRFQWTFPIEISPHDHNTVYATSQVVHRTTNGGQSWEVISPDLTTNDKSRQGISGGLTPDNLGVEYCCVIYAFDESPARAGVLYAGTNDGLVQVSRDNGANWSNVTGNFPDLPADGVVRTIDASKWDAGKAYVAIEFHQVGNFAPYLYKTEDYGQSWTKITEGISDSPLSYARSIHEDPVRPGLLYAGTENALYVSFDDGARWESLMTNLPPAPMYGLVVQEHFNDLVVGTYGRGFWILDDITPLQQLTPAVAASAAHLFAPRPAYRFHNRTSPMTSAADPTTGENPPYGASINYWLREEEAGEVTIRIANAAGDTLRTMSGSGAPGINRIWWNLRGAERGQIRLRTKALYADWAQLGAEGWRSGGNGITILQPPGTYTVALEVGGRTYEQQVEILKDPNSEGSESDIATQVAMLRELQDDLVAAASVIEQIEWIRRQFADLEEVMEAQGHTDVVAAMAELGGTFVQLEEELMQLRATGRGQDIFRWPARLARQISYLAGGVATADFPPNDQQREVHQVLKQQLTENQASLQALLSNDLPAFNRMLEERNIAPIGGRQ